MQHTLMLTQASRVMNKRPWKKCKKQYAFRRNCQGRYHKVAALARDSAHALALPAQRCINYVRQSFAMGIPINIMFKRRSSPCLPSGFIPDKTLQDNLSIQFKTIAVLQNSFFVVHHAPI